MQTERQKQAASERAKALRTLIVNATAYADELDKRGTIALRNPHYEHDFLTSAIACVDDGEFNKELADLLHDYPSLWQGEAA